ncbi:MAG: rod shape-determining protein [Cyclobacteriaceae bacterium]|nr:rod shape-determining protein [Cyclobacteriaceae bacterium]
MGLLNFLKDTIGIDPGSKHLRIIKDNELVFNEPAQLSFDKTLKVVTGLGNSIKLTDNNVTINPVDCTINDFHAFEMLLRGAVKKTISSNSIFPKTYKLYFCIPTSTTEIEKRAYRDSAEHVGAIEVHMIHQSCCSAIGLNILFEKKHFMLIDFGFSKIEMTVFINSDPISVGVIRMGTSKIYRLIKNFLKRKYKIHLNDIEIESLLSELKTVEDEITIQYIVVKTHEIHQLLDNFFHIVNDEFIEAMERVDLNQIEKAKSTGIYFTGGGSTIDLLRDKIMCNHSIKRTVSQNPLLDNINGVKKVITQEDKFKKYTMV